MDGRRAFCPCEKDAATGRVERVAALVSIMTATLHTRANKPSAFLLSVGLAAAMVVLARFDMEVDAQATVTVTGYSASHSAVKIYYRPVPGAKDYRVYDVANPNNVKYAGLVWQRASTTCPGQYCDKHFVMQADGVTPAYPYQVANGPTGGLQVIDGPAVSVDWNSVGDGAVHTLVVEAVDMLGPVPQASLYQGEYNTPVVTPMPAGAMLGGNKGPTNDGKTSTNGQGPYTNIPQVIARSQPFTVQADRSYQAIPSRPSALQRFFDTFETGQNSTIVQVARDDRTLDKFANIGMMRFTMGAGTSRDWGIEYRQADNNNSMPFISSDHFMDMLFDGATAGSGAPGHENVASMAMTPTPTIDMTGGKILHMTMEVDGHQSKRKWMAFNLSPASDPIQAWHPDGGVPINTSNRAMFLELRDGECTLDIYTGPSGYSAPTGTAGGSHGSRLWGPASASSYSCSEWDTYVPGNFSRNGLGFDDKSRYDLFISETRVALFQDGHLIRQSAIPAGSFSWINSGPVKAYFTHYVYHTTNDVDELMHGSSLGQPNCYPMNAYWFNNPFTGTQASETNCGRAYPPGFGFRYSDERHWDNMGFETLAASEISASDYSGFLASVRPPVVRGAGAGQAPGAPSNLRIVR